MKAAPPLVRSLGAYAAKVCGRRTVIFLVALLTAATATTSASARNWQPKFPIRAAFYYPWYTGHWAHVRQTNFHPALGFYRSSRRAVIARHIRAMQYGRIEAGISSWWGRGTLTDRVFRRILNISARKRFRWAIFYEDEGYGDPSSAKIRSDLRYIRKRFASKRAYLRVRGRFVVFVWATGGDRCDTASRWRRGNTVRAYVVLKIFPRYRGCRPRPASWYEYAPVRRRINTAPYSYTVSPGFWKKGDGARLGRSVPAFRRAVRAMARSRARFKLITTFNEWMEGTAVENAREWNRPPYGAYLRALHRNGR
jgi:Glycosyl hydrolase family 99